MNKPKDRLNVPENETHDHDDLMLTEESGAGEIRVSHDVVASIVRIAASDVPGVVAVGGSGRFRDEIAGLLNKGGSSSGIHVGVNETGNYEISVKVILRFGVELAKVGEEIQISVREQVAKMTNKKVARIDVFIDGVRMPEKERDSDYEAD